MELPWRRAAVGGYDGTGTGPEHLHFERRGEVPWSLWTSGTPRDSPTFSDILRRSWVVLGREVQVACKTFPFCLHTFELAGAWTSKLASQLASHELKIFRSEAMKDDHDDPGKLISILVLLACALCSAIDIVKTSVFARLLANAKRLDKAFKKLSCTWWSPGVRTARGRAPVSRDRESFCGKSGQRL